MTDESDADPLARSQLTPAAGRPARRALAVHGYTTYEHLTTATAAELLKIHGVGPKAIRILGEELTARGLDFRVRPPG
ncbi:helix-hairpin-helix domain-containing protein [Pseudonocardia charpentierae]|uniref:DNA-binding protein n=1 Tax=Pseudonocardia charpentierae TaxID=3075545 RepID=A0ABU2N714_9PSEU|nr:DNA-binding protein [Pseudonocardia sp. DSM 45834]MDT0349725.1 DNA-binding protein [Pseudonocardia sp. DSM 45834]